MSIHILVVEDEQKLANILARYLESSGYRTTVLYEGSVVLETILRQQIDLVLLDLMLPGVDGVTLCQQIRRVCEVPIMIITARVDESDRISGLDAGADDYICKPFSLSEVGARVRAMLRRPPSLHKNTQEILIDEIAHKVFVNGRKVDLTLSELRLLKILFSDQNRAFTRDELLNVLYQDNRIVTYRTIDVHVKNLRLKLHACGLDNPITTIYGVGYRWQ